MPSACSSDYTHRGASVQPSDVEYRQLTEAHIARLPEIRADYVSDRYLRVRRSGHGLEVRFSLHVEKLEEPFRSQGYGIIRDKDQAQIRSRMGAQALQLVVEHNRRLIAVLDAAIESWRNVLKVWDLLIDEGYRLQGIGTGLIKRAKEFGMENDCRAVVVETRTTNWPALNFYLKMGFHICAVDDHFYTNLDIDRKEVALFMHRELS